MKTITQLLISFYQIFFSPFIKKGLGITHSCRFAPTCSRYTLEAVKRYGLIRGVWLGLRRVLRCNPLCQGGVDLLK